MLLVAALLLSTSPTEEPRDMEVGALPEGECSVRVEGRSFHLRRDAERFRAFMANLPDKQRPVTIIGGPFVSYRCIGGIIYEMQRNGFSRVGFISKPPDPEDR